MLPNGAVVWNDHLNVGILFFQIKQTFITVSMHSKNLPYRHPSHIRYLYYDVVRPVGFFYEFCTSTWAGHDDGLSIAAVPIMLR